MGNVETTNKIHMYVFEQTSSEPKCILECVYDSTKLGCVGPGPVNDDLTKTCGLFREACRVFCTHHIIPKMNNAASITSTKPYEIRGAQILKADDEHGSVTHTTQISVINDKAAKIKIFISRACSFKSPPELIGSAEYIVTTDNDNAKSVMRDIVVNKYDFVKIIMNEDQTEYERMKTDNQKGACTTIDGTQQTFSIPIPQRVHMT